MNESALIEAIRKLKDIAKTQAEAIKTLTEASKQQTKEITELKDRVRSLGSRHTLYK